MKQLVLAARLIFGAWMLLNAVNYFFFSFWPTPPAGHEPLASQLMDALVHSRLLNVAMTIQLVTGALILTGFFVPVALCVVMPISTCALYWSVILDHRPLGVVLSLAAFALNGLLMLAYLDYYQGVLQRSALMLGETGGASFDLLLAKINGRTSRNQFVAAAITLVAVIVFYSYLVPGRSGEWSLLVLVVPGAILLARRLHDMGHSAWPVTVPAVLTVAAFAIWLRLFSLGAQLDVIVPWAAFVVCVGFALWGCVGKSQAEANSFGAPVAT